MTNVNLNKETLIKMKLKNKNIKISELREERTFVSGTKNWRIEWAELFKKRFKVGDKVSFFDEDAHEDYFGVIDWMIVTEQGNVEVSISDTPLGRIDLESIEHVI